MASGKNEEVGVRGIASGVTIGLLGMWGLCGCGSDRGSPPPAPARVPGMNERRGYEPWQLPRPLANHSADELPPPPYQDVPVVSQEAPEQQAFVDAYQHVGRPRIVVWVARPAGAWYDEAGVREIDYAAMENILIDWLSAGGRVAIISPEAARQALNDQQVRELQAGQVQNGAAVAERLRADVLVLVRAEATRQVGQGVPEVRMVADASNLKGGESLARAVVDVPPPLEKTRLNNYTRFVARKLMRDMTGAWNEFGAPPPPETAPAPPPESAAPPPPPPAEQPAAPATEPATTAPAPADQNK